MKKEIGIIGLGKMGAGVALRLRERGWRVVVYNRSQDKMKPFTRAGCVSASSPADLVQKLSPPRIIWSMLPAGQATHDALLAPDQVFGSVEAGDIVIDAANGYYEDARCREKKFLSKKVAFIDVGFSGGPHGARNGGCLMVGGNAGSVKKMHPLFSDLAVEGGYLYCGESGAGHFVKMIHNGIEYGMMQAIAEGFTILKRSRYKFSLQKIAKLYNHGSVIESRLIAWLMSGYSDYGDDLQAISGSVAHTGEGKWTVEVAKKMKIPVPIIEGAYLFRLQSTENPSYMGRVLSTLRNKFGGHTALKKRVSSK